MYRNVLGEGMSLVSDIKYCFLYYFTYQTFRFYFTYIAKVSAVIKRGFKLTLDVERNVLRVFYYFSS